MKMDDGISRRLETKLGNASVLVIPTKFHYLVCFEERREKEHKYHFPDHESNQRPPEYKVGMLTTTQGSWLISCQRRWGCVVSPHTDK
jgi:hypothetical protein